MSSVIAGDKKHSYTGDSIKAYQWIVDSYIGNIFSCCGKWGLPKPWKGLSRLVSERCKEHHTVRCSVLEQFTKGPDSWGKRKTSSVIKSLNSLLCWRDGNWYGHWEKKVSWGKPIKTELFYHVDTNASESQWIKLDNRATMAPRLASITRMH